MGAAIARELNATGYDLVLMSPSANCERLAATLGGVARRGVSESAEDVRAVVDLAMSRYGRIDAVVNQAASPPVGELVEISDEAWGRGHDLIVMSVARMARQVTPIMERQGKGAIVNITTFCAFEPMVHSPVSSVYRAGVGAYTKLYSDRYAASGIRMNSILPGYIDSLDHKPDPTPNIPMKRIGTVLEIAKTTAFLLSDGAGYITGQNLRIDGGFTRHV